jgi:phosphatidylserine decarboxylase
VEFHKRSNNSARRRPRAGATYSALIGWTATQAVPTRLRPLAYRAFARAVGANLDECELDLAAYPSLGAFFARRLRAGMRTIDTRDGAIISPCDGALAARGVAVDGSLVQAKGRTYRLAELLADDDFAARFTGGAYATVYLSPKDYHRVHAPVGGEIESYDYIPGYLWPVNPKLASRRDGLLARNERVVIRLKSHEVGHVALVMVGAAGVGNIRLAHGPDSAALRARGERHGVEVGRPIERGDELGAFHLGSTVVIVFEPGRAELAGEVGTTLRFGEAIGTAQDVARGGAA